MRHLPILNIGANSNSKKNLSGQQCEAKQSKFGALVVVVLPDFLCITV